MQVDEIRKYCLAKRYVTEDMPFGQDTLVFRIGGKMFLLTNLSSEVTSVNLKCDPVRAIELRDQYESIRPGYHMNKKHWNTVVSDDSIPRKLLLELIDHSYELVLKSLSNKDRQNLRTSDEQGS
ncbi:MAG: MmcQ/YjbR family DNA-binding protein [Saprospiraceae bacterium]|nr:MmcQ/YjbR family DNA-binding protein [Saprospiraceae bacterium]